MKDWNMLEQVKDATTPTEMRAELYRLKHFDPLVRAVFDAADYGGMSTEDRYTLLAYSALKQLSGMKRHLLEDAMLRPSQWMIAPSNPSCTPDE
jgi:hypothetical protein